MIMKHFISIKLVVHLKNKKEVAHYQINDYI